MTIPQSILERKGSRTKDGVPQEVLRYLEAGQISTKNLMENLATDRGKLLECVGTQLGFEAVAKRVAEELKQRTDLKYLTRSQLIAQRLEKGLGSDISNVVEAFQKSPSDIVRTWAAYIEVELVGNNLKELLKRMRRYASDEHFGVREDAWLCVRSAIVDQPIEAIAHLEPWKKDEHEGIRRFATEATRPIGVWCPRIPVLLEEPELGLPVLSPLRNDESKYVQDSVANWLNDAAKQKPDWVLATTEDWLEQSPTKATTRIVKRARRSIK